MAITPRGLAKRGKQKGQVRDPASSSSSLSRCSTPLDLVDSIGVFPQLQASSEHLGSIRVEMLYVQQSQHLQPTLKARGYPDISQSLQCKTV
jgi:hypothetical protein